MGCTGSKQARRDGHRSSSPQYVRSYSLPVHDIGSATAACRKGDHVVSLTSSTLGALPLDYGYGRGSYDSSDEEMMKTNNDHHPAAPLPQQQQQMLLLAKKKEAVGRAKAWSEMIERRIPKTPTVTPPNEPENINAWELMAGLEDASPVHRLARVDERRAFSFHSARDAFFRPFAPESMPRPSKVADGSLWQQPQWMQLSEEDSIVSEFDPEILSSFRMALEELSPEQPSSLRRSPEPEKKPSHMRRSLSSLDTAHELPKSTGIVQARISAFQQKIDAKKANKTKANTAKVVPCHKCPPDGKGKVVFYFTSLRGVRKTYEDCWTIKLIVKGYGVRVDDRDVSMHGGFKEELIDLLGPGYGGNSLPRVFANGNYLGGAEEVRHLHETGELSKLLEGCEMAPVGKGGGEVVCQGCGDVRFVPCETCSGSCKVFVEEEEVDEDAEEEVGGFRRCPDCNENGLMRCPLCC